MGASWRGAPRAAARHPITFAQGWKIVGADYEVGHTRVGGHYRKLVITESSRHIGIYMCFFPLSLIQQNREVRKVHNERNVGSVFVHRNAFAENPKTCE